jgi:two-component sensor histidine kinase
MISDQLADQTRQAIAEALDRLQAMTLLSEQLETQISDTAEIVRSLSGLLEQLVDQGNQP